jgi:hypothetical protein
MKKRIFRRYFYHFDFGNVVFVLVAIFLFVFSSYTPVNACTPTPITPWFTEKYEVLNQSLPKGIGYAQVAGFDKYSNFELYNTSGDPLLITGSDGKTINSVSDAEFLLITDDQEYYTNDGIIYFIESRNLIGDKRPSDVKIPDSQYVRIPMQEGQEKFLLQVKVSYTLNQDYRPNSVYDSKSCERFYAEQFWETAFLPIFLLGLGVIVLVFVAMYKRHRKKQKGSNPDSRIMPE